MTIIIASVSTQGHVTSSDGRVISNGRIVCEKNDKTFSLYNGKIRGAYAGMMSFGRDTQYGSKEARDYIVDTSKGVHPVSIGQFAEHLKDELLPIIQNLTEKEWPVEQRRLVIFLTGGEHLKDENYMIIEIKFEPANRKPNLVATIEKQSPDKTKLLKRCNSDSDVARDTALSFLDKYESKSGLSTEEMLCLHEIAITNALEEAEKSKRGSFSSCGGQHFFQPSYKY
jgi:hypothetical protein